MSSRLQFALCLLPLVTSTLLANDEPTSLPTVILVGDSIRMSYAPTVAHQLANQATIVSATTNGGDSSNVVKHLDEWVIREKPAIVHFNCGIRPAADGKIFQYFVSDGSSITVPIGHQHLFCRSLFQFRPVYALMIEWSPQRFEPAGGSPTTGSPLISARSVS